MVEESQALWEAGELVGLRRVWQTRPVAAEEDPWPGYSWCLPSLCHHGLLASWLLPLGPGMKTTSIPRDTKASILYQ